MDMPDFMQKCQIHDTEEGNQPLNLLSLEVLPEVQTLSTPLVFTGMISKSFC